MHNVRFLTATDRTRVLFADLLARHALGGGMVTDAAIVASAIEHSAMIHTNDTDFARFREVEVVDPLA